MDTNSLRSASTITSATLARVYDSATATSSDPPPPSPSEEVESSGDVAVDGLWDKIKQARDALEALERARDKL